MSIPRPEYPRPDLVRDDWFNLNGEWEFAFDDGDVGVRDGWHSGRTFEQRIVVPFAFQAPLSGIGTRDFHPVCWYRRQFEAPAGWYGKRVKLHFGAVDYEAAVYVNGRLAGTHRGGHTPFSVVITPYLRLDNHNELVVRVFDGEDLAQPRGKQYWERDSGGIWYTRTTGIWQTVWLEALGETAIERLRVKSWDIEGHVSVDVMLDHFDPAVRVKAEAFWNGAAVASAEGGLLEPRAAATAGRTVRLHLQIPTPRLWDPDHANLYDLQLTVLKNGATVDQAGSYFGIRNLHIDKGSILLNGHSLYQRLILDQGYWPDGLMTAPSDGELKADITRMKEMGFNGCRKHMKVEDPRFLYWADKLGYLVWGEMPAAWEYSERAIQQFTAEWQEAVVRDRNHPCIVTWTPINESWGVDYKNISHRPDQWAYLDALYQLTRALDGSRPVNGNDGWQNPETDLATIHDYAQDAAVLRQHLETYVDNPNVSAVFSYGWAQHLPHRPYDNQPLLVTEYGGINLRGDGAGWGYGTAKDGDDLAARYDALTGAIQNIPEAAGFCYTQLSDVEQEQNGLYTYDRKPKVDPAKIRAINERRRQ